MALTARRRETVAAVGAVESRHAIFCAPYFRCWSEASQERESMSASLIGRSGSSASDCPRQMNVTRGLVLLSGIGTRALPSWDSRTRRNDLLVGLAVKLTAGPSGHTNSPHPSSREGHHSTAWWSSRFLLSDLMLPSHAAAASCLVQRNSVPSTQMRCMTTASRRARATIAFLIPRRLAICIAQALSQDHFLEYNML